MMSADLDGLRPEDLVDDPGGRDDPLVGRVLQGRYEVRELIARGGMGKIYRAEQVPLGRPVALKVLDLGYSADFDPEFRRRFFLEAATSARLAHPNTIRIFDYGHEGDVFFIAMEIINGRTLLRIIKDEAPLDPLRVIHIARQMCGSLGEAHGLGVIHRDLKPSNVLITRHGDLVDYVKVLDFGLVKLLENDGDEMTKSGLFLGSPNYMSPEQIRAKGVDQRSDIYSLGVIIYRALTGKVPFSRSSSMGTLVAQLEDDPPTFSQSAPGIPIPAVLERITMRCLDKDAEKRLPSVQELDRALAAAAEEIQAGPPAQEPSLVPGLKRPDEPGPHHSSTAETDEFPATPQPPSGRPSEGTRRRREAPKHTGPIDAALSSPRLPWAAGAVLAILFAVFAALLFARTGRAPAPDLPPASMQAPAPAVASAALDSDPSGAVVLRGSDFLGTTPIMIVIPPGERWRVTLQKVGRLPEAVEISAGADLMVVLPPEATVAPEVLPGGESPPRSDAATRPAARKPRGPAEATPAPERPSSDLRDPWGE